MNIATHTLDQDDDGLEEVYSLLCQSRAVIVMAIEITSRSGSRRVISSRPEDSEPNFRDSTPGNGRGDGPEQCDGDRQSR